MSLFTGAGGLDLGLEAAGFRTCVCVEIDAGARATLSHNRPAWRLATPGDIHEHSPEELMNLAGVAPGELELLAGGPPCQPFSKSSYWVRGDSGRLDDPRAATLSAYLKVVDAVLPRVILLENVRGLTYAGKDDGLKLLLDGFARINRRHKTKYQLHVLNVNAASYGVPQVRERVILVGSRDGKEFLAPKETHGDGPGLISWMTAWDAIGDLENDAEQLSSSGKWARLLPSIPEGANYLWHTPGGGGEPLFGWRTRFWSFLLKLAKDRPSWTLQAEPGPATGPFHWKNRPLSDRELCRLQTFPDDFTILGDRRAVQRQLGNAVPSALAEVLGNEIRRQLLDHKVPHAPSTLIPMRRRNVRPRERIRRVPDEYHVLRGDHRPHPGKGLGPGALERLQTPAT